MDWVKIYVIDNRHRRVEMACESWTCAMAMIDGYRRMGYDAGWCRS